MSKNLRKPTAAILTILAILGRLMPHFPNTTPLGASAIFGGAKLNRPWNYLIPLAVLFLTDIFLGFHSTMLYVYGSFLVSVWLGERFLKTETSPARLTIIASANAIIFFIVTNFGVWATPGIHQLYPKTLQGLIECYVMGLPFLRNMMVGDIIFAVGFFTLYSWAARSNAVQTFDNKLSGWLA